MANDTVNLMRLSVDDAVANHEAALEGASQVESSESDVTDPEDPPEKDKKDERGAQLNLGAGKGILATRVRGLPEPDPHFAGSVAAG